MIGALLIILVVLWLFGFLNISFLVNPIIGGLTLMNLLIIGILLYIVFNIAPTILRTIIAIALIIYVLSLLGIIAVGGLSNIIILAVVVVLVMHIAGFRF